MESSTKDNAEGTMHQLKGKVKEVAGIISDNPKLEAEGTAERMAGKVQVKIGQFNKLIGK
ncbi:MAG: CsbD family protein [Geobacteraceae bacterium GWC2_58_44]|nr:MAG: CsbD family protein [Geobacteraceae bacterium GWC2_58_44]HBG05522.1 CsbD family protein [Geobacter sp.]